MTLMHCNYKIAMQLRRLLLPTHKMRLLCNLKNSVDSRHGHAMEIQTPQACYNQARTPKPSFLKSDCNYVVGTIWENVRKCFGCKHEFLPASAPDNQFVLVRPESDWYFDKQTKSWRLGRKSNRYYHIPLQCVQRNNPQFSATKLIVPANTPAAVKAVLFEMKIRDVSLDLKQL